MAYHLGCPAFPGGASFSNVEASDSSTTAAAIAVASFSQVFPASSMEKNPQDFLAKESWGAKKTANLEDSCEIFIIRIYVYIYMVIYSSI